MAHHHQIWQSDAIARAGSSRNSEGSSQVGRCVAARSSSPTAAPPAGARACSVRLDSFCSFSSRDAVVL